MKRFSCLVFLLLTGCYPAPALAQRSTAPAAFRKYVTKLPAVDRIEISELKPVLTGKLNDVDCKQAGLVCAPDTFPYQPGPVKTLSGAEAIAVASMWRAQKWDRTVHLHGCLAPDHLLRFFKGDKLILQTQVCAACHDITLPMLGVVRVEGPFKEPYFDLRGWLLPDSLLAKRRREFTDNMLPKVGQELAVIGLIALGKGVYIDSDDWEIELDGVDVARLNELLNLGCHAAVRITGVLQHYTPPPAMNVPIAVQMPPDHFYFVRPQIEVIRVEDPHHRK